MTDRLCLITGGSRGLGAALTAHYLRAGWTVREFSRSGDTEAHVDADFSRRENAIDAIDHQMRALKDRHWDEVLVILNSAQVGPVGPLSASQPRDWWQSLDVNLTVNLSCAGLMQKHFQGQAARKTLIALSSGAAREGMEGWGLYCLAKSGLERFIEAMAQEQGYQAHPIGAISISPGLIDTDMQAQIRASDPEHFHEVARFQQFQQQGALRPASQVAGAVTRIAASEYRPGQCYSVEGWLSPVSR
ncbi:MAG: SDR family NAD(P)-dependent oxidoreductase [Saccharospirillum sp.]